MLYCCKDREPADNILVDTGIVRMLDFTLFLTLLS
jgi:hypothetical protein